MKRFNPWSLLYDDRRLLVLTVGLIVVAGLSALAVMPRMEDPVITQRAALINTFFPGASPQRVESLVTDKLEAQLQEIEEIKELRSSSRSGISTITVELKDSVLAVDEVWSRVRDKVNDAAPLLPPQAGEPEFEDLEATAYASIVALVWDLPGEANYAILRRQAELLEDRLREMPGTRDVELFGEPQEEILVEVRAEELGLRGLTVGDLVQQLRASDAKVSAGVLRTDQQNLVLEVDTELDSLERIRRLPVRQGAEGTFALLGELAEVSKGFKEPADSLALVDDRPAVVLGSLVGNEQRIDRWNRDLQEVLAEFGRELTGGVRLKVLFEQSRYVQQRLHTLLWNLAAGAAAILGVIGVMMGWRSALVVGSALPLVALMVLAGMQMIGIPLHQMSIMGLIIALGMLIDNAIVAADEVRNRLAAGVPARKAVNQTARYLAVPLLGSTATTVLSFGPIALMPGPTGEFVFAIAYSVILAVSSSLLVALTITPAFVAIFESARRSRRGPGWWNTGFSHPAVTRVYSASVDWALRHPVLAILAGLALPMLGFVAATRLPIQFFPPTDRDQFQVEITMTADSSLAATERVAAAVRQRLLAHPQITAVEWFLGESAPSFFYNMVLHRSGVPHIGQALVQTNLTSGVPELIRNLQTELSQAFPEARVLVKQLEQGPPFDAPVEMRLFGPDLDQLRELGDRARAVLAETPGVIYASTSLSEALPKLDIEIDEEQTRLAGLDHLAIAERLSLALEGATGGSVLEVTEELPVRVRLQAASRKDLAEVAALDVGLPGGKTPVPLSALAAIRVAPEETVIPHFNTQRMNEVHAQLVAGVLPSLALTDFQSRLARAGFQLPPGYCYEFGGEASKRKDAVVSLMSQVSVIAMMMVAALVLSLGSFRLAAIILGVAILSVGWGMGSLYVFGYPFGFMAILGTMGLVGVAVNDSIMVLAALREDAVQGKNGPEATRQVVIHCTRHVLATTITTVVGFLPLILAGGEFWPPLAVAIAGGLSGSTLVALYSVPAAHLLLFGGKKESATLPVAALAEESDEFAVLPEQAGPLMGF